MPQSPDVSVHKKRIRDVAVARRMAMPDDVRLASDQWIATHLDALVARLGAHRLAFCWPHRGEPDVRRWVAGWLSRDAGHSAALPVVVAPRHPMVFRRWTPDCEMVTDRYGIPHPPHGDPVRPELLLLPVNAFDRQGYRIGYGGGYFDRTLAALDPAPLVAGIAYHDAEVASALPQPHDVPMHWVVTDRGIITVDGGRSGQANR